MELSRVKGLGPAKVEVLQAAGIMSAEDLASVDLRKRRAIQGVQPATLKTYKQRARQLLQSEGLPFETAPYAKDQARTKRAAKANRPSNAQKAAAAPAQQAPATRGLFARLFRRT